MANIKADVSMLEPKVRSVFTVTYKDNAEKERSVTLSTKAVSTVGALSCPFCWFFKNHVTCSRFDCHARTRRDKNNIVFVSSTKETSKLVNIIPLDVPADTACTTKIRRNTTIKIKPVVVAGKSKGASHCGACSFVNDTGSNLCESFACFDVERADGQNVVYKQKIKGD